MSILPRDKVQRIEFCETHNPVWAGVAVSVGTTTTAVTDLTTKTTAARAAFNAKVTAEQAAKAATITYDQSLLAMVTACSDILKSIKTKASVAGDSIYALAQIPAPATPSPVPAPGICTDFSAQLSQGGSVTIKWKCANPRNANGPVYEVSRQIGTGAWSVVGISGTKSFEDTTLPAPATAAASTVTYRIVAIRATARGPEAFFTVRFGNTGGGSGALMAEVLAPKLAA